MKKYFFYTTIFFSFIITANAQNLQSIQKSRIAIFAPLFLDSAFDANNNYRHGVQFPKYINPGLEFYEGALLALDSLAKVKAN